MIGAGTYADDRACAVSATGAGEFFIREGVAHEICARMRLKGDSAKAAADAVMAEVKELGGTGGVIVVSPEAKRPGPSTRPACSAAGPMPAAAASAFSATRNALKRPEQVRLCLAGRGGASSLNYRLTMSNRSMRSPPQ